MPRSRYNNSLSPLNNAGSFTGVWEDCSNYKAIIMNVLTDQTGIAKIQFTDDKTNIISHQYDIQASGLLHRQLPVKGFYYRLYLENDSGSNQTAMNAYTQLKNDINEVAKYGWHGNLASDTSILAEGLSSSLDISHGKQLVFLYEDTDIASSGEVELHVSVDNSNYYPMTSMLPVSNGVNRKSVLQVSDIGGISYVKIYNSHASETRSNVYATILTSS